MVLALRIGAVLAIAHGGLALAGCGDSGTESTSTSGQGASGAEGGSGAAGGQGGVGAAPQGGQGLVGAMGGSGGNPPIVCSSEATNVTGECDMLNQDCGAGRRCVNQAGTATCVDAPGLKGLGSACSTTNECQAGLFCQIGKCSPVCCPNSDEPCDGGVCNLNFSYGNGLFAWFCTYSQQCELFTDNACPPGENCQWESFGISSCFPPTNLVPEGQPCEFINNCGSNQLCSNEGAGGVCRYLCDFNNLGAEPGYGGCPESQSCSFFNSGFAGVGVCEGSMM